MGDFNIDLNKTDCIGFGKLEEFCDNFNLTNIVKKNTCFTKTNKSTIDLLLTNKPMYFQVTKTIEAGLSDCHKLISSFILYLIFYINLIFLALNRKLFFTVITKTLMKKNLLKVSKQQIFLFQITIEMRTIQSSLTLFRN